MVANILGFARFVLARTMMQTCSFRYSCRMLQSHTSHPQPASGGRKASGMRVKEKPKGCLPARSAATGHKKAPDEPGAREGLYVRPLSFAASFFAESFTTARSLLARLVFALAVLGLLGAKTRSASVSKSAWAPMPETASARSVNALMTATYWEIGRLVEFEQQGQERAEYGEAIIKQLTQDLKPRFGRDFE